MPKNLVIVESPTKAKTLKRFLGADYVVESSVGHVRDLPTSRAELPEELRGEPWAKLGVNVADDFRPVYVVHPDKKKKIAELRRLLKDAETLYLATDEDREGEAISWHLLQLLAPKVPVKRMVFHEITRTAILDALRHTRAVDEDLVEAQEARRIIDRLYGFEVSEMLWRKVARGLSAGRVQSVAIRMLVEREMARMRFRAATWWDLVARFTPAGADGTSFEARLASLDGRRVAEGRDFDPDTGHLTKPDVALLDEATARALADALGTARFGVAAADEKPFSRTPSAPFTTSTLQQEGNRKLRFDAKRTMRAAQRLYESGFITYMRTDSVALSDEAVTLTRRAVEETYGAQYLSPQPRRYTGKVKNAQEAHEAIRPAGERVRTVDEVAAALGHDEARVYELIWKRTMACQMADARGRRMTLEVAGDAAGRRAVFQARGSVIDFPGFLRAYVEGSDDPDAALAERDVLLPPLEAGDALRLLALDAESHETTPPARLTEATLVKALEESGIGRPSTYASIIETILSRHYTFRKGTALVPTFTAFAVVRLMKEHLSDLVDYEFTARMEDRLDAIARGEHDPIPYLREFYFGNGTTGLRPLLDRKIEDIDARKVCTVPLGTDAEGREIAVRVGKYGPYLQRGEDTANVPDACCPDELTVARANELIDASRQGEQPIGHDPASGEPVFVKSGRFGPYVQLGSAKGRDKGERPKMVSLPKGVAPEQVALPFALQLLSLPRPLGDDPHGILVEAGIGRYGPYVRRGGDYRNLEPGDDVLTVELPRALELLAQEKRGRAARPVAAPIKVFEKVVQLDGADVRVLAGRYGPYVTDGEYNASLPRGTADPTALTLEDALQLLADARARGPRKRGAKRGAKRTTKATGAATGRAAATKSARKTSAKSAKKTTRQATKQAAGGDAA